MIKFKTMRKTIPKKYFIESDVFLAHKPVGISSFGLLKKVRTRLGIKKIGHAGTLDPLASGLMIVGIGKGTKKMTQYLGLPKIYLAEVLLGKSTTTGDQEGDPLETKDVFLQDFSKEKLEETLKEMLGEFEFPAPLYSAVKVNGKPLYRYAREGKEPPFIPTKKMLIKNIQFLDFFQKENFLVLKIRVEVGSGTYVRTLAEKIGEKLSLPASLKNLYRIRIGEYSDYNAFSFEPRDKCSKALLYDKIRILLKNLFK